MSQLKSQTLLSASVVAASVLGCSSESLPPPPESSGGGSSMVGGHSSSIGGSPGATDGGAPSGGATNAGGALAAGGTGNGGTAGGGSASDGGASSSGGAASAAGGTSASGGAANAAGGSGPVGGVEDPSMRGFAAVAKYGVETTTGGSSGPSVTVSSFADLKQHAESAEIITIQVSGTISAASAHELIRVQSNKTIMGIGNSAQLNKITLSVNSWDKTGETCEAEDYGTFTPASNVIIRNLEFLGLDDFPDDSDVDPDAIRVECYSHHVWIDHNTFQYGADGATDVKRGGDMVTLSYNHYVKTEKTALVGHSDNNGAQDRGFLNVTFHHNFFDETATRTPRVRFGYAHVYNNYYNVTEHVFRIGPEGRIYAEANNVVSTEGKILRDTENEGALTWTSSNAWDPGAYGDVGDELLDADQSVPAPPYTDPIGSAPSSPPAAGVGKL